MEIQVSCGNVMKYLDRLSENIKNQQYQVHGSKSVKINAYFWKKGHKIEGS